MERVLLSHGISKLAPTGCGPFVAREHAVVSASASGKLPADVETVMVAETVRAGYRHDATGAVLRRAKVGLAPAPLASPAGSSSAGSEVRGRGGQTTPERGRADRPSLAIELRDRAAPETAEHLHDVAGSDTLQGLAVRFGVQPGALLRLNRLPSAQALHGRRQIRIPAAACGRAAAAATGAGAAAAAPQEMQSLPQAVGARPGQIQRVIGSQRVIPSPPWRSVEMERDGVELVRGVSPLVEALAEAASRTVSAGYHPLEPQREASGLDSPRLEAQREALASMEGDHGEALTLALTLTPTPTPTPTLTLTRGPRRGRLRRGRQRRG